MASGKEQVYEHNGEQMNLDDYLNKKYGIGGPQAVETTSTSTAQGTTNYVTNKYALPTCHVGPKAVMKIGNATLWAGGEKEFDGQSGFALRIRIGDNSWWGGTKGGSSNPTSVVLNAQAEALFPDLPKVPPVPTIDIDWSDYGAPDELGRDWWEALIAGMAKLPEKSDVGLNCMGGHGRTGTALSIIAGLTGLVKADECPVTFIRQHYCKKVVESHQQIDYIEKITGLIVKAKPSHDFSYATKVTETTVGATTKKPQTGNAIVEKPLTWDPLSGRYYEDWKDPNTELTWRLYYNPNDTKVQEMAIVPQDHTLLPQSVSVEEEEKINADHSQPWWKRKTKKARRRAKQREDARKKLALLADRDQSTQPVQQQV